MQQRNDKNGPTCNDNFLELAENRGLEFSDKSTHSAKHASLVSRKFNSYSLKRIVLFSEI